MMFCNRAAGGVFNRIISPGQNFLQHKNPNGSAQSTNALSPGALRREEATNAVNFRDQHSHGSLALKRD
jgi:hypothetical protein